MRHSVLYQQNRVQNCDVVKAMKTAPEIRLRLDEYEEFRPEEAKRIADKIEWHYTPEHGSWLNMAELELSALQR